MAILEAIGLTLALLILFADLSAASWMRTAASEAQRFCDEVPTAMDDNHGDITLQPDRKAPAGAPASSISPPSPVKAAPEAGRRPSSADDGALDIPAALVGARWKEIIERFAPILGTTPVGLLRAAIDAGLTGGRPITAEMLDMLDKLVEEGELAPPSKPPPFRRH